MRNPLIIIFIIASSIAIYFLKPHVNQQGTQTILPSDNQQPESAQQTNNHTSYTSQQINQDAIAIDEPLINLWEESEKAREVLQSHPEKLPGDLAGETYIELNTEQLKQMQLGDVFELTIPQLGTSFAAEVDQITQHPNGDKTIEANFPGMDAYYSAVITLGETNSYAQISTPDGVYLLESQGDYAWIASRNSLVASHWPEHEDGVAIPATPVNENELNNDDVDVEFDYVIQESSPDDKP
jgi:hypothetical protein